MADFSLDEYIHQRGPKGPKMATRLGNRLGQKKGPGVSQKRQPIQGPRFTVTGLGQVKGFDARQKITTAKPKDAREKILQKTKFTDARVRIQNKQVQNTDARSKIDSAKAKKVDAREKIKARKGGQQGQVTVTGLSRVMTMGTTGSAGVVAAPGGQLLKTIKTTVKTGPTLTTHTPQLLRTVDNSMTRQTNQLLPQDVRTTAATKTIVTKKKIVRTKPLPTSAGNQRQLGTMISLKNNYYEQPQPQPIPVVIKTEPGTAPPTQPRVTGVLQRLAQPKPTAVSSADDLSPLQGFRVLVTNLHQNVSQEDVVELFGDVGALKKARLIKPGTAEVVFVKKEEALTAIRKYHMRELDGLPMQVQLTTPGAQDKPEQPKPEPPRPVPVHVTSPTPTVGPPRWASSPPEDINKTLDCSIDPGLIHRALFRTVSKDDPPSRPVTFTVKI